MVLSTALDNDKLQLQNDLLEKDIAEQQGQRWKDNKYRLHSAAQQGDLIASQIDEWLENTFSLLPRIELDTLVDKMVLGIRTAKSLKDAERFLAQLKDLQEYVYSLNTGFDPNEDAFLKEIAKRSAALTL